MGDGIRLRSEVSERASLCRYCTNINLHDLRSSLGYEHRPSWSSLRLSSCDCVLCNLFVQSIQRSLDRPNHPQRDLEASSGPVRIVAAGRSRPQQSDGRRFCEGAVDELLLWKELALILGQSVERNSCFFPLNAQVMMFAAHDSPAEKAGVQGRELNARFAFTDHNICSISRLLDDCKCRHSRSQPQCSLQQVETIAKDYYAKYRSSGLPARLIDVSMEDQSKIRLVDVKTRVQYVALSYRWGTSQRFVTTADNIALVRKGIDTYQLSKTVQDAILICRTLKVRHLWVDALCIIQSGDNGADWSLESQKMGLIYAQAYATIAAACSDDSEGSFLSTLRDPFVRAPFRDTLTSKENGSLLFAKKYDFFEEDFETAIYENSLAKRGWVMQERIFSRRTIYFTDRQIYWECPSLFWSEDGNARSPLGADSIKMAATFYRCLFLVANVKDPQRTHAMLMLLKVWSEIVTEYSELELTFEKDRLPGIQGLARIASLYLPGRYFSGLWERDLSNGLLWTPKKRPMTLCRTKWAPSWSWASTNDAIVSHGADLEGETDCCIVLEKVLGFNSPSETLTLSGYIHPCEVSLMPEKKSARRWKDPPAEDDSYRVWFLGSDKSQNNVDEAVDNVCRLDGERGAQVEFFFFIVRRWKRGEIWRCRGLILSAGKDHDAAHVSYTRVGVGWASQHVCHDWPNLTISLE